MEYLLAPGIGIVKFRKLASREDGSPETVWHLTGYAGKGGEDDYFPIYGQFTRRYEPETVREGFDAATEYTFAEENGRVLLFRNAWCLRSTQEPTGEKK